MKLSYACILSIIFSLTKAQELQTQLSWLKNSGEFLSRMSIRSMDDDINDIRRRLDDADKVEREIQNFQKKIGFYYFSY
jgi:hypothetical protein